MLPRTLYAFVMEHGRREQLVILGVTMLSFPLAYLALELPKIIIDDAIMGAQFPASVLGVELSQVGYLIFLCVAFFGVFCLSNLIKFILNMLRGLSGERLLRRMRYVLVARIMQLRPKQASRVNPGELVQTVVSELQPIGGFIGDAFAAPILHSGLLLVYVTFIFMQDPWLGLASIALFPVQAVIVPLMQRRVVKLTQQRLQSARELSDEVAENLMGLEALRRNAAIDWRLATLSLKLHENFELRYKLFQRKFLIKFINNILSQIVPFAFYMLGGYFVIKGELQIGALVAVIAAYRDLATPWRELLKHYQTHSDVTTRYQSIVERFAEIADVRDHDDLRGPANPASLPSPDAVPAPSAEGLTIGPLRLRGAPMTSETLVLPPGGVAAIRGGASAKRSALAAAIAAPPSRDEPGVIVLNGRLITAMPPDERAGRIALVEREPLFVRGRLRDNLLMGVLRPTPETAEPTDDEKPPAALREAMATGNFPITPGATMIDLALAKAEDETALDERLLDLAEKLDVMRPIFQLGLGAAMDEAATPALNTALLAMRADMRAPDNAALLERNVVFWRPDEFNPHGSILENLLFAASRHRSARGVIFDRAPALAKRLAQSPVFDLLVEMGAEIVERTADLIESQEADSPLLRNFDLFPPSKAGKLRAAAARLRAAQELERERGDAAALTLKTAPAALADPVVASAAARRLAKQVLGERAPASRSMMRLAQVALSFSPARHRLPVLTQERREQLLAARPELSAWARSREAALEKVAPLDDAAVIAGLSVRENALFGKRRADRRDQASVVDDHLWELANRSGAAREIARLGLDQVVEGGLRGVGDAVRQRLALVRALAPLPELVVLDGPAGGDEPGDEDLMAALRAAKGDAMLVYASDRRDAKAADPEARAEVVIDLSPASAPNADHRRPRHDH